MVIDTLARPLRDLRISVTDRCNFRCVYCMPKEVFGRDFQFLSREELLSFEEVERLTRAFHRHGVRKVRLTGGEPLVRREVEKLVALLARLPDLDLTMTTNGLLLPQKAAALKAAGLQRITVSLDSLDEAVFQAMNDVGASVAAVLRGIEAAEQAGMHPIKINMVVKRGVNESSVLPMVRYFARRLVPRDAPIELEDGVSEGNVGLVRAARAFDPKRGVAFSTFAAISIRGAIIDALRRATPVSRRRSRERR